MNASAYERAEQENHRLFSIEYLISQILNACPKGSRSIADTLKWAHRPTMIIAIPFLIVAFYLTQNASIPLGASVLFYVLYSLWKERTDHLYEEDRVELLEQQHREKDMPNLLRKCIPIGLFNYFQKQSSAELVTLVCDQNRSSDVICLAALALAVKNSDERFEGDSQNKLSRWLAESLASSLAKSKTANEIAKLFSAPQMTEQLHTVAALYDKELRNY